MLFATGEVGIKMKISSKTHYGLQAAYILAKKSGVSVSAKELEKEIGVSSKYLERIMREELGVPISYMGIVSMIISGGTVVSSILSDRLTTKLGTRIVTVSSVFLTVIALFGFSFATKFWMLIVFAIPYGLGAGAIDAALNNYVALHYKAKHMSWLHCFWGVGTIVRSCRGRRAFP